MRILGLDYGSKTVGVAVSDPLGLTAQKVETIWRKQENKLRRTLARIEELVAEYGVEKIVVGLPKNRVLMEGGVRREDRKEHLDSLAAVLILQGYLDCSANR